MAYGSVIEAGTRVLVTGASGFIGSHLTARLLGLGADVWAVTRSIAGKPFTLSLRWIQADLSQPAKVDEVTREVQPDVIFHLAGVATGSRELEAVFPTFEANLRSTVSLLTAATRHECKRLVLVGSGDEPLGNTPDRILGSPYAVSKWAAGGYASLFFNLYQTMVVNARLFMVYGPGRQDLNKVVPYTILSLLKKQSPKMSSGKRLVDWIYVEDVVEGLLACAKSEAAIGKTVDIGTGTLVSVREVAERIAKVVDPGIELGFGGVPDRPFESQRKAELQSGATLDWQPRMTLDDGLKSTIEWFRLRHGGMIFVGWSWADSSAALREWLCQLSCAATAL
jgi:UDP-glucose 4-epimerase